MPDGRMGLQDQFTPVGREAAAFHNNWLLVLCAAISLLVLALLLYTIVRYRRAAHPTPSRTSHNTFVEVVWTLLPVLVLVAIAIPSIRLIRHQYSPPPADLTIKVIGNQWYWTYQYPDNGGFEIVSNMLKEKNEVAAGARGDARVRLVELHPCGAHRRAQVVAPLPELLLQLLGGPGEPLERGAAAAERLEHADAVHALFDERRQVALLVLAAPRDDVVAALEAEPVHPERDRADREQHGEQRGIAVRRSGIRALHRPLCTSVTRRYARISCVLSPPNVQVSSERALGLVVRRGVKQETRSVAEHAVVHVGVLHDGVCVVPFAVDDERDAQERGYEEDASERRYMLEDVVRVQGHDAWRASRVQHRPLRQSPRAKHCQLLHFSSRGVVTPGWAYVHRSSNIVPRRAT